MNRRITRFVVPLVAAAAATAIRLALDPWFDDKLVFVTYFAAIAIVARYWGFWPGCLAALASYLAADYFFIPPRNSITFLPLDGNGFLMLLAFVVVAGTILALNETLAKANRRMQVEANRASEQRRVLEVTLESIGDGVIATDGYGRVTFLNGVAANLTGWTSEHARGRMMSDVFNIVNEQTRERVEDPIAKVLRSGKGVGLANHTILIARDGRERPIDDSAAPIIDAEGNILGVVLVFRDATRQREAEQALQKLAAIVEHSDDAVIGKSIEGTITSWNTGAERLYQYTAKEAIGRHIDLIVPEHQKAELATVMQRLRAGEMIDHWDTVRRRKDGSFVEVSLRISPIRDGDGRVVGASKVARDISQRRSDERSARVLANASRMLSRLSDHETAVQQVARAVIPDLADMCVIYAVQDDLSIVTRGVAHRDPYKEHLLNRWLGSLKLDWNSPAIAVRAMQSGKPQLLREVPETLIQRVGRNDEERQMLRDLDLTSIVSIPLIVRNRTVGALTVFAEQPRRPYDERDVQVVEDLAGRIATAIDNTQLFQSVQESVRQKDEFLAMLAHELRNPLAAIRYATALARMPSPEPQMELFDVIERQVSNLGHLIDDLLDVSRINRDKIKLKKEHSDAVTIAKRALATVRPLIEEKGHQIEGDFPQEQFPLFVDAVRAEQIVANILTNAAKYTPPGGKITLRVLADAGTALIKVRDTGIGIPPDMLPTVFELFTQADRTLDRSEGGLGIGLTVARRLAELHGGSVWAASDGLGKGAEFTIHLPIESAPREQQPASEDAPAPKKAQLRVLVVDDNRDTARSAALLLKNFGHEVREAYDGLSAIGAAHDFQPHAVLLDIGLPGMSGLETARRLRAEGLEKQTLIAISGYGQPSDIQRSLQAGFNQHLVKPVELTKLLTLLNEIEPPA